MEKRERGGTKEETETKVSTVFVMASVWAHTRTYSRAHSHKHTHTRTYIHAHAIHTHVLGSGAVIGDLLLRLACGALVAATTLRSHPHSEKLGLQEKR